MKTILVIDDERDVLEVVRTVLKAKAYKVLTAGGGDEGLELAEVHNPDLIIVDLMMPRISGMEVIKRLKRHDRLRRTPILVLSAVGRDTDRPAEFWTQSLGVDEFMMKPFDPLDLLGRVEFLFRRGNYVSTRSEDSTGQSSSEDVEVSERPLLRPVSLISAPPEEIARLYIESWNTQDFGTEYNCLADELTGGLGVNDYISSRINAYRTQGGEKVQQRMGRVLESKVSGVLAKVVAERVDTEDGQAKAKQATLTMKKTSEGWKLVRYQEGPMPAGA